MENKAWTDLRYVMVAVGMVSTVVVAIWALVSGVYAGGIFKLAEPQYHVIFGVPFAVLTAAAIVGLFRTAEGPVKFKGLGFEFEGASGEIVMWLACFVALVLTINLLWPDLPAEIRTPAPPT